MALPISNPGFMIVDSRRGLTGSEPRMTTLLLTAATTIRVPPLGMARIPHMLTIVCPGEGITGHVWIMREAKALREMNLIVDTGILDTSLEVETTVFNLSNRQVKIARGDCISRLLWIPLA